MGEDLLIKALVVIAASVAAVAIFVRLRAPTVVGYLAAGLLLGPHGLALLDTGPETHFLAELGVIFLMFMVGLEFSISAMLKARRDVLGVGGLNVLVIATAGAACCLALGANLIVSILLGAALAMSSTAMTVKALADRGEITTSFGSLAVAVLVFQDLAALPLLVAVDAYGGDGANSGQMMSQLLIAAAFLVLAALFWKPIISFTLAGVARTRHADLFLLTVLMIAIGASGAAHLAGVAPSIGAFLAGMALGESDFRHQVEDDVRPFRDVLVGLFFVTVGMQVDVAVLSSALPAVIGWVVALTLGKAVLAFVVLIALRKPLETSVRTALVLAHGGEFSLLLMTQAASNGVVPLQWAQPFVVAIVVSLALAPLQISQSGRVANRLALLLGRPPGTQKPAPSADDLTQHVILCGCGRVGRLVATVLEAADIRYVAIESDLGRFQAAKRAGAQVIFGDASRLHTLEAAHVATAKLIVVTFDRRAELSKILHGASRRGSPLATIVSAADDREMAALAGLGAGTVFPENLAAGFALADQTLVCVGKTQDESARVIREVRAQLNPELGDRVGL